MKRTAHTAAAGTVLSARTLFGERLSPWRPSSCASMRPVQIRCPIARRSSASRCRRSAACFTSLCRLVGLDETEN